MARRSIWLSAAGSLWIAVGLAGLGWGARAPQPAVQIFGSVQDASGKPLADILVRWIPISAGHLRYHDHDSQVVGEQAEPDRLPQGALREALKQSLTVRTDPGGRYQMQVTPSAKQGVVVVSGSGVESALGEVRFSDRQGNSEDDSSESATERELNFRLSPGGRIEGSVAKKASGGPAAGMAVEATPVQMDRPAFYTSIQKQFATMVNEDGSYALRGLPAGVYRVRPVTGYGNCVSFSAKQGLDVVVKGGGAAEGVDFQVQPGGTIRGRARGPDGQPLADVSLRARMSLDSSDWPEMLERPSVRSGQQGEFEIRGLRLSRVYRLVASHSSFAQARGEWIELMPNSPEATVEMHLDQGHSISGHVRFENGEPASGYRVRAFPTETDYRMRETRADESGAFLLANLPPGGFRLQSSPAQVRAIIRNGPQIVPLKIEGSDLADIDLVALSGPGHRLAGQALDDRGHAVARAWLQIAGSQGEWSVFSGTDGRFVVEGLPEDRYVVMAQKAGHSQTALQDVGPGRDDLIVALQRSGWVSGRIVAADGSAPDSPGQVEAVPEGTDGWDYQSLGGPEGWRGQSLSDGSFRIQAPAGKIEVRAAIPHFAPAVSAPFQLHPGEEVSGIVIPVLPAGRVRGQVSRADGSPVSDAEVSMMPVEPKLSEDRARWRLMQGNFTAERHRTRSDSQGSFDLPGLAQGDYWLLASHPHLVPSELRAVTVRSGEAVEIPDLILEPGGAVSGQIWDGDQAVAGVRVQLSGMGDQHQAVTDGEGLFLFEGVIPGSYHLYVVGVSDHRQGIRNALARSIAVRNSQTLEVDIDYQQGGRLFGSVSGLPAASSHRISLTPAEQPVRHPRTEAYLRPDGSFEIRGIEPGRYLVEVNSIYRRPGESPGRLLLSFKTHCTLVLEVRQGDMPLEIDLASEQCLREP